MRPVSGADTAGLPVNRRFLRYFVLALRLVRRLYWLRGEDLNLWPPGYEFEGNVYADGKPVTNKEALSPSAFALCVSVRPRGCQIGCQSQPLVSTQQALIHRDSLNPRTGIAFPLQDRNLVLVSDSRGQAAGWRCCANSFHRYDARVMQIARVSLVTTKG